MPCEKQTRRRRDAEDDWMKILRTIFPYGLNELAKSKLSNCSEQGRSVGHLETELDLIVLGLTVMIDPLPCLVKTSLRRSRNF